MKYLAIAVLALVCTTIAAQAQFFSSDGGAGRFHGYGTGLAPIPGQNIRPSGSACPINLRCGKNPGPLDPNAPTYAAKRKAKR
jgi:hypothetical protein